MTSETTTDVADPSGEVSADYTELHISTISEDGRQVVEAWERAREGQALPRWSNFRWEGIPSAIVPHCGVVDVYHEPFDLVYRFWGTAHAKAHDQELTGRSVRDMRPEAEAEAVFEQYRLTVEAGRLMCFRNEITFGTGGEPMIETSLRLPFSDDGSRIDQVMAFSDIQADGNRMRKVVELLRDRTLGEPVSS